MFRHQIVFHCPQLLPLARRSGKQCVAKIISVLWPKLLWLKVLLLSTKRNIPLLQRHISNFLVQVEVDLTNPDPTFAEAKLAVLTRLEMKVVLVFCTSLTIFTLLNQICCILSCLRPIKSLSENLPQPRPRPNMRST
jgi:hypothetical protein